MYREITITTEAIQERELIAHRQKSGTAGAAVCFVGMVREMENGQPIGGLEYESFKEMAAHQFGLIITEIEKRWPVESIRVMHRVGEVKVNEVSVWMEVVSVHREEAFAACQYLIEEMKRVVPIWKKPIP